MYNILVVDDEKIHRQGILSLLAEICPQDMFWEASDGVEAMEILKNIFCEIVISDIKMSRMDGLTLLKNLKDLYPETYFIIISGYADFSYAKEAIKFKAAAYLLKPVDQEELFQVMEGIKKRQAYNMEEKCKEPLSAYMEWLLNRYILPGSAGKNHALDEILNLHRGGFFLLSRFKIPPALLSEEMKRGVGYAVKKLIEPASALTFSISGQPDVMATLVFGERPSETVLHKIVTEIEKTDKISREQIYFAVSLFYEDMETWGSRAFNEAMNALNYAFYEKHHFLWAEKYKNRDKKDKTWELGLLLDTLRQGKTEQAEITFQNMLEEDAFITQISPEMLKRKTVFLFFRILRILEPFLEKEKLPWFNEKDSQFMEIRWYSSLLSQGKQFLFYLVKSIRIKREEENINPMEKCREYLQKHYMEELSLETVAAKFHFNPSYFSTLFKQSIGTSFSEFLSCIRMEQAVKLLSESEEKIKNIALKVGYRDSNYFIRSFKKRYGVTPEDFRRRER